MNPENAPVGAVVPIVESLRRKGVELWVDDGQLRYRAPKGALQPQDVERLRAFRQQVLALLDEHAEPGSALSHERTRRVPLAYTQLSRWNLLQRGEIPCRRQIASATRVAGRLHVDALQRAIDALIRRHDALRTQIIAHNGQPMQEIVESLEFTLKIDDLGALDPAQYQVRVDQALRELIDIPVDISTAPLFEIRLLRLGETEHVLVVLMEHMISDAFSMGILLRELFVAYAQAAQMRPIVLPPKAMQFADHALRQANSGSKWLEQHGSYWREQLGHLHRLRFPDDDGTQGGSVSGWATIPARIDAATKARLLQWSRSTRTTLAMAVFTAYVALVLRWCGAAQGMIRYQSDGRSNPEIERTIGFFAAALHMPIALVENDTFVTLIERVTRAYCTAYERNDHCYMSAQMPRPQFTRNSIFNWIPQPRIEPATFADCAEPITCAPWRIADLVVGSYTLDNEPLLLLHDTASEVVGDWYFPTNRFSVPGMQRLQRNFLHFVTELLERPHGRVHGIELS